MFAGVTFLDGGVFAARGAGKDGQAKKMGWKNPPIQRMKRKRDSTLQDPYPQAARVRRTPHARIRRHSHRTPLDRPWDFSPESAC
jgi:hypothetical protein